MFGSRARRQYPPDLKAVFRITRYFAIGLAVVSLGNVAMMSAGSNGLETTVSLVRISGIRYTFYALALASGLLLSRLNSKALVPRGVGEQLRVRLRRSVFVLAVIFEFLIMLGLIIFFMTETMIDLYVLTAYALILVAIFFPRYNTWHEHEQREGQLSLRTPEEAQE